VAVVKTNSRYAGGVRRLAIAAAAVAAFLGLGLSLEQGRAGRAESLTNVYAGAPASTAGGPTSMEPTGAGGQAVATASPTAPSGLVIAPAPRIVVDHLRFGAERKAETAAYAERHYGRRSWRLDPTLIVLHYTESDTYASARSLFDADLPNRGERPGTCAHYVVDQDGTIYELVPPTVMCRHAVGLNDRAIGIEFVQSSNGHDSRWAVQQVLRRKAQSAAGVALIEYLQGRFAIEDGDVIGHAMVNDAKEFRDLEGWRNDHTDWQQREVARFRSLLDAAP
jgi:hypothetical protein